jgi:hypothetical protein
MKFAEHLQLISEVHQRHIILDTPPECATLLERARQDGIMVRRLYVLSEPLYPYRGGGCDLARRDIWVLFRGEEEGGLVRTLRTLLHELAHLAWTKTGAHSTIDQDWDEEARTWARARELAQRWGMETCFSEADLQEEVNFIEQMRENHWEAGNLSGALHPRYARAAYDAICMLASQRGWTLQQLSEALGGYSEDTEANAIAVGFDRCLLRWSWSLPYGYGKGDFGPCTLQQSKESAHLLRRLLASIAQRDLPFKPPDWKCIHAGKTRLGFLQVEQAEDLTRVLAFSNALLLDHDDLSAHVCWWVYGTPTSDPLPRLYRLCVAYRPSWQNSKQDLPETELWIRFPASTLSSTSQGETLLETTWQRYVLSWQRSTALYNETLDDGLMLLWHWWK